MANRIVLKRSSVANRVPLATDLVAGELAVNLTDKLLYTKDAAGNVITVGDGGGAGGGGTVTGVTATAPVVSSGGTAPVISMAAANTTTPGYLTAADWNTFNGKQAALGYTPYNATNPSGYISGITSANVTTALGFTPYNSTNPNGYISSITSANVTTALGYTPYNSSNPSGYITSSGSISGNAATATNSTQLGGFSKDYFVYGDSSNTGSVNTYIPEGGVGANAISRSCFFRDNTSNFTALGIHIQHANNSGYGVQIGSDYGGTVWQVRGKVAGTWGSIATLLTSGNYTSYAPSLTGSGASGTWGINITGNAATVSNGVYTNSSASISGDNYFTFGPNSSWGKSIRIGGNGRTLTTGSSVVTTNGNLHLDSADGNNLYLNYYAGGLIYLLGGSHYIYNGGANYTGNAASASSVAWGNVSSKPGSIFYYAGWATDANTVASNSSSFCYSVNAAATGPLAYFEASGYGLQLSCGYGDGSNFYWRVRNGDNGTWQSWRRVLTEDIWINNKHFGSDGNIYSNASMRAPIFYDQNDTYYSVDPNGTSRLANRLYLHNWIEFVNYYGLYSPNNGAHFYPNDASYGSWRVAGSRNGWAGLEFDASNGQQSMMVSTSGTTIGWHNNSYGWKFQWEGGRMYCFDSTYGGGPQRMLLMQDTWQGSKYFGSDGTVYHCFQYDANDTGYYLDANGTSRMNSVVANNLYAYGTVTAYYSDDRLKTRFSNIADALDKVCSLNGFFYVGNSVAESLGYKKKMEVGLSAQEVQRILPEVVVPAPIDENYLTIQYDRVVPLLVEAIKELRLELNQLKSLVKL